MPSMTPFSVVFDDQKPLPKRAVRSFATATRKAAISVASAATAWRIDNFTSWPPAPAFRPPVRDQPRALSGRAPIPPDTKMPPALERRRHDRESGRQLEFDPETEVHIACRDVSLESVTRR